jgi:hypothetical protein
MRVEEAPPPVFVDASGRRRRRLRRFAYSAAVAVVLALLLLWLSQLGTSVRPAPVHPCASASAQAGCGRR